MRKEAWNIVRSYNMLYLDSSILLVYIGRWQYSWMAPENNLCTMLLLQYTKRGLTEPHTIITSCNFFYLIDKGEQIEICWYAWGVILLTNVNWATLDCTALGIFHKTKLWKDHIGKSKQKTRLYRRVTLRLWRDEWFRTSIEGINDRFELSINHENYIVSAML